MKIKITTDYTLRILTYLILKNNVANSKEISDHLGIPQKNVLSIGRELKKANYVNIINGPYGGYLITKTPEDILLYDIVSMFEGVEINCHSEAYKGGNATVDATVNNLYSELQETLEAKLKSKTLDNIISGSIGKSIESEVC